MTEAEPLPTAAPMTFGELIQTLRSAHVPRGTQDVVLLRPGSFGFLEVKSVEAQAAIDQFEAIGQRYLLGEKATPLEQLGILLLVRSAGMAI